MVQQFIIFAMFDGSAKDQYRALLQGFRNRVAITHRGTKIGVDTCDLVVGWMFSVRLKPPSRSVVV